MFGSTERDRQRVAMIARQSLRGEGGDIVGTIKHLPDSNFPSTLERRWVLMSALIKCLVQWEML